MKYRHTGGGSNGLTPEKARFMVTFTANCEESQVNEDVTWLSNEDHPHEKEVVLEKGTALSGVKMEVSERSQGVTFVSPPKKSRGEYRNPLRQVGRKIFVIFS